MSESLKSFISSYKEQIMKEKIKLGIDSNCTADNLNNPEQIVNINTEKEEQSGQKQILSTVHIESDNKENIKNLINNNQETVGSSIQDNQKLQARYSASSCVLKTPFDTDAVPERHMLRYGEFSPNNPELRGPTQPYLGIGEYEHRKQKLLRERHADFQEFLSKVQYELRTQCPAEHELSPQRIEESEIDTPEHTNKMSERSRANQLAVKIDRVQIGTQNNIIVPGQDSMHPVESPAVSHNSPRARLMADLKHSYFPSFYDSPRKNVSEELVKVNRQKWDQARQREQYHEELRLQIEEKQRQAEEAAEKERREEQALTRRLERQLHQLQLERDREDAKRAARNERLRRNEEEFLRRQKEYQRDIDQHIPSSRRYRSNAVDIQTNSKSEPTRNTYIPPFYYSPPSLSKRNPYSFNISQNSVFANSLPVKNYNADFAIKHSSKLNNPVMKRDSCLTFTNVSKQLENVKPKQLEDSLPIPILKVKSPIAHNLKHSSVVGSTASPTSEALKTLEGKWQVPAVQKNILKNDFRTSSRNKNVLTQLGAIRMQLQQEQMRLDQAIQQQKSRNTTTL